MNKKKKININSILVYLNDDYKDSETYFKDVDGKVVISKMKGKIVIFEWGQDSAWMKVFPE